MKCLLLMTGHELMTGVTVDTNSAWISEKLDEIGITVYKIVTIDDRLDDLVREIKDGAANFDLLIINGGLGPTDDDLTAKALSLTFNQALVINQNAEQHIINWCHDRKVHANAANLKQALLPETATVIPNISGSAVGIRMQVGRCLLFCTPGVPHEMKQMMTNEILPTVLSTFPDCHKRFTKRLQVFGMGESSIQHKVHTAIPDWPQEIELGFRAGFPTLEIKLTVNDKNNIQLREYYEKKLKLLLGSVFFGEANDTLAQTVITALKKNNQTITVAESCTGGLIASQLTGIPGASEVFEAGFVTYSNNIKNKILKVNGSTLEKYGAVSEQTVIEMAQGALNISKADYCIAVSGIAGPNGGSNEKPVGTAWLAWGQKENLKTHKFFCPIERKQFQILMAAYGLDLIRREINAEQELPAYLQ